MKKEIIGLKESVRKMQRFAILEILGVVYSILALALSIHLQQWIPCLFLIYLGSKMSSGLMSSIRIIRKVRSLIEHIENI